ncbi:Uncharacterised protein [Mycobacterium tuberculosis]|nr:Uncharacterised protein [Mycobacterium tuberculosis]
MPLAPLPTSGRPASASTGENTASFCAADTAADRGDALAASAAAYAPPALFRVCTNAL